MERQKKLKFLLLYTAVFCIVCIIVFFPFIENGKSFVWNSDAKGQYFPNYYFLYTNIIESVKSLFSGNINIEFPSYSFTSGLGSDVTSLYFQGLLDYAGVILGRSNLEMTFGIIILFRLYFSGLSFSALAFYWKQKPFNVLCGALVYVFTGFTLYYGMRHMSFLVPMIMLPVMVLGVEKILRRESPWIFFVSVAYMGWTGYYFLYMNTLVLGIYICVRWWEQRDLKKSLIDFRNIVLYYILGVGLAAVSLFPRIYKLFSSNRLSTATVESGSFLTYGKNWIMQFFTRLISPYTTDDYTKYYMLYAVSAFIVIGIVSLFLEKRKELNKLKVLWVITTFFFFVPIFAFVLSGFNSLVNRWSYAYTLVLGMIVTVSIPSMKKEWKKTVVGSGAIFLVLLCIVIFNREVGEKATYVGIGCLGVIILCFVLAGFCNEHFKFKYIFETIILATVIVSIGVNGQYIFGVNGAGFVEEFADRGTVLASYEASPYASADVIKDEEFGRIETSDYSQGRANSTRIFEIQGTTLYESATSDQLVNFNRNVLNRGQVTTANFYGFDGRSWLEALAGVDYYIAPQGEGCIPYGFEFYKEDINADGVVMDVYRNQYALPIGYTYGSYISEEDAEELDALELQQKMLGAVVISEESSLSEGLELDNKEIGEAFQEVKYSISKSEDIKIDDGYIDVGRDNTSVTFTYNYPDNSEVYLMLEGLNIDDVFEKSFSVLINGANFQKSIWVFNSSDKYRTEDYQDYCVNLGYNSSEGNGEITITFPYSGQYKIDSLKLLSVDMDNYSRYIEERQSQSLQNVNMLKDRVTGEISSERDQLLCMSIPYSEFWTAYVDGKEVQTECVNYMWTGIPLEEGEHDVEFVYQNSALLWGGIISGSCLIIVIFVILKRKVGK